MRTAWRTCAHFLREHKSNMGSAVPRENSMCVLLCFSWFKHLLLDCRRFQDLGHFESITRTICDHVKVTSFTLVRLLVPENLISCAMFSKQSTKRDYTRVKSNIYGSI